MTKLEEAHFQSIDLRELAAIETEGRRVLSLYLPGQAARNEVEREIERLDAVVDDADRELLQRNAAKALAWIDEEAPKEGPICLFVADELDLCRGYVLAINKKRGNIPSVVRVGASPYLRPLAELQDEYETFAVVATDNRATRIFVVDSTIVDLESQVRGDVKNSVRKGGWSQKRYARRREKELSHYAKDVAEQLTAIVESESIRRIVFLGTEETIVEIRNELPQHIAERDIGSSPADLHEERHVWMSEAFDLYFEEEREEEHRLWDRIRGEYMGGGPAAVGPDEVLVAATAGRVDEVIVTRSVDFVATRCNECQNVSHGQKKACPFCKSEDTVESDFVNELTRAVELTSASIEFSDEIPGLTKVGHVAALLRY